MVSGSFGCSIANYSQKAGNAFSKISKAQFLSKTFSMKDEYISSEAISSRNSYPRPSKGSYGSLQLSKCVCGEKKQVIGAQPEEHDIPNTPTDANSWAPDTSQLFFTASVSVNNFFQFFSLGTIDSNEALISVLKSSIEAETKELADILNNLIRTVGLEDETDDILVVKDINNGNIKIWEHSNDDRRTRLTELINSDFGLVERLNNHMAKLDIVRGLENKLDISTDEFASTRRQLLGNFLQRKWGVMLADIAVRIDPEMGNKSFVQLDVNGNEIMDGVLLSILGTMPGLEKELLYALEFSIPQREVIRTVLGINGGEMRSWQALNAYNDDGVPMFTILDEGATLTERIEKREWGITDIRSHDIYNTLFSSLNEIRLSSVADGYGYSFSRPGNVTLYAVGPNGEKIDVHDSGRLYASDNSGLHGLTLEERDKFYAAVQKIFDKFGVNLDARKESFVLTPPQTGTKPTHGCSGHMLSENFVWTPFPGGWVITHKVHDISRQIIDKIQDEILVHPTLRSLFEKAAGVRNGTIADDTLAQQYSIRVVDDKGNLLARDRIIVEAKNGNQIEMSVDEFVDMSRKEITAMLR